MDFETAFRAAFAEHFATLFRYLDRLTGDPALASDVAQDTFITLYQRGSMPDHLRSWLVTVANNRCRDEARRVSRRARLLARLDGAVAMGAAPPSADAALIDAEWQSAVRRALDALSERDRQCLLLRADGYSYRELALALDVPEQNISTYMARARAAFRRLLNERVHASR